MKPILWQTSQVTDYAADMTVALVHFKCLDDWQDEHSLKSRTYDAVLKRSLDRIRTKWSVQWDCIETQFREYDRLEREHADGGALCACFGQLMSELFVWREDEWAASLRYLGRSLGEFICLMDAAVDYEVDKKAGSYNVLAAMNMTPPEAESTLKVLAGHVTAVFEKLPLEQDLNLLRSILYLGIWQQYRDMLEKKYHIPAGVRHEGQPGAAE